MADTNATDARSYAAPDIFVSPIIAWLLDYWDGGKDRRVKGWRCVLCPDMMLHVFRFLRDDDLTYVALAAWEFREAAEKERARRNAKRSPPYLLPTYTVDPPPVTSVFVTEHWNMETLHRTMQMPVLADIVSYNTGMREYARHNKFPALVLLSLEMAWRAVVRDSYRMDEAFTAILSVISANEKDAPAVLAEIGNSMYAAAATQGFRTSIDYISCYRKNATNERLFSLDHAKGLIWRAGLRGGQHTMLKQMEDSVGGPPPASICTVVAAARGGWPPTISYAFDLFRKDHKHEDGDITFSLINFFGALDVCPPSTISWMVVVDVFCPRALLRSLYAHGRTDILAWLEHVPWLSTMIWTGLVNDAVQITAANGQLDTLKWLASRGRKVKRQYCENAIILGHTETADWILEHGTGELDCEKIVSCSTQTNTPAPMLWCVSHGLEKIDRNYVMNAVGENATRVLNALYGDGKFGGIVSLVDVWMEVACANKLNVARWLRVQPWGMDLTPQQGARCMKLAKRMMQRSKLGHKIGYVYDWMVIEGWEDHFPLPADERDCPSPRTPVSPQNK